VVCAGRFLPSVQGRLHGVVVVLWSVVNHLPSRGVAGGGGERFVAQVCECAVSKACQEKVITGILFGGDGGDVLGCRSPVEGAIAGVLCLAACALNLKTLSITLLD
jgi:hypothetical protein